MNIYIYFPKRYATKFYSVSIFLLFSINYGLEWNMNPKSWFQKNEMILSFDEVISTHVKSRMHRLDLCISIGDLVKPYTNSTFKTFLLLVCLICCVFEIKFDLTNLECLK